MVKRKTIEERMKQTKKKTNRDRLIQALKDNDLDYLCWKLVWYTCDFCDNYDKRNECSSCTKGIELWLDREVSDE